MMPLLTGRPSTRFACAVLLVFAVLAPGCGRPPDEAWLRFLGFKQGANTIGVFEGTLDGKAETVKVDAVFENRSLIIGKTAGTGVLVSRAHIDYRMTGYSPPAAEYPLNLYIPAASTSTSETSGIGTLTGFPLAPVSLENWLIAAGANQPVVELSAHVTFFATTDDGTPIETEGSIGITLTAPVPPTPEPVPAAKPLVTVAWLADAVIGGHDGGFTVSRSGSTAAELTVAFTTSGTAVVDTDYYDFGSSVLIPAGSSTATITVTAIPTGTSGTKVTINLSTDDAYTVGTPASATLTIAPKPVPN